MTTYSKTIPSLATAALFGFAITCDAAAHASRYERADYSQISACVSEIGERVDYRGAPRVVHEVHGLNQVNRVELEIRIRTTVHPGSRDLTERTYESICLTAALGKIVRLRVNALSGETVDAAT